jgi:hypothetical protein
VCFRIDVAFLLSSAGFTLVEKEMPVKLDQSREGRPMAQVARRAVVDVASSSS